MRKQLPNFILGGVSASGTSFLAESIRKHPDIYLSYPMEPECHFFFKSWEFKKGISHYSKKWFSKAKQEIAIGERSSSYLFGGIKTARRIFSYLPNIKLIFCIRNPIERAWANYRFTVLQGFENLSFIEALKIEKERIKRLKGKWKEIQHLNYTGRGMYFNQLVEYYKIFPKENILIIKSEFMRNHKKLVFKKVFDFLGVQSDFTPIESPDFIGLSVKNPKKQFLLRKKLKDKMTLVIERLRKELSVENFGTNLREKKLIKELVNNLEKTKLDLSIECRDFLSKVYQKEIQKISKIVDFDVKDWV